MGKIKIDGKSLEVVKSTPDHKPGFLQAFEGSIARWVLRANPYISPNPEAESAFDKTKHVMSKGNMAVGSEQ
jgi:hypothetical protein